MSIRLPEITSIDIDPEKYSLENLQLMRDAFPGAPDEELARYLIGRKNDFEEAKAQLIRRKTWAVENLPVTKAMCGQEFLPGKFYLHGVDKEGRPLLIWRVRFNFPANRDINKLLKTFCYWTEAAIRAMLPQYSKYTVLMDRSGFKQENADMEMIKAVSGALQDTYVERLSSCILHPVDLLFYTLWNIGKWFIDPVTREKVKPMLQFRGVEEFIDRKYIPCEMGGDCDFVYNPDDYEDVDTIPESGAAGAAAGEEAVAQTVT
jgi:hypothetical protein